MAVDSFIPEVWSAELQTALNANLVLSGNGAIKTPNTKNPGQFGWHTETKWVSDH